jgi:ribose transport system substrate-binding protein
VPKMFKSWLQMLLMATVVAVGGAACGSTSSSSSISSSSSAGSASATGSNSSNLAAFNSKVAAAVAAREQPDPARPPASGPSGAPGKKIYMINCSEAIVGCKRLSVGVTEAAKDLGWNLTVIDDQSDPTKAVAGIDQALAAKADGIITDAIDAPTIQAGLARARAAGVKTVGINVGDPQHLYTSIIPLESAVIGDGYVMGEALYELTHQDLKAVVFSDDEFLNVKQRRQGFEKFIADCRAAGGKCEIVNTTPILAANLATTAGSQAASVMRNNPNANAIFTGYGAMALFVMQGLKQAGLSNIPLIEGTGDEPNLQVIRSGGQEKAAMGLPLEWEAYQAVDNMNRLFKGQKPVLFTPQSRLLEEGSAVMPKSGGYVGLSGFQKAYQSIWHH